MQKFFFDVIGDHRTTKVTSPPSIVHHVLLFYGLHITNRRSGIGQGAERVGRRAERAGDFVIVTCIVKSAAAAAGLEVAVAATAAGGRGGAKCVSYGGYIEEVIPAVRDILANRRHRRIVLYPPLCGGGSRVSSRAAGCAAAACLDRSLLLCHI